MKLFSEFTDFKIYIYNQNKIKIENYRNLIEINLDKICIDNILIKGTNLFIKELNEIEIIIEGVLSEIIFN